MWYIYGSILMVEHITHIRMYDVAGIQLKFKGSPMKPTTTRVPYYSACAKNLIIPHLFFG